MGKQRSDPSINEEPHRRGTGYRADPSEARAERASAKARRKAMSEDEKVEHGVWDEPGISPELAGAPPEDALTYADWLDKRRGQVLPSTSWAMTLFLAELAGPWAVLGALWGSGRTFFSIVAIVVFAPVIEETMKVAAALYVVEKKPFLFRSSLQIAVCALAGGLTFAVIENLLYIHVYTRSPSSFFIWWRWTLCTSLHVGCSFIAGLGLARIWRETWRTHTRPRLSLGYPYMLTAVVIHGLYNVLAVALHVAKVRF